MAGQSDPGMLSWQTGQLPPVVREGTVQNLRLDGPREECTQHWDRLTNLYGIEKKGPVTDYSSTLVHWMRHRQPRYKGSYHGEAERPSPSYIIDVSLPLPLPCSVCIYVKIPALL
jgi:hypothetical protein